MIRLPDGGVQEGPYVAGERQGWWVLRYADGTIEEGFVAGGLREGRWVAHRPDGSRRTFEMPGGALVTGSVRVVARAQGGTRGAAAMTREERRRVQAALAAQGFGPGPADGVFGPRTRRAIQAWQASNGYAATGALTGAQAVGLHSPGAAPRRAQATAQGGSAELLRLLGTGWASVHEDGIRELLRQRADPNATDGNGNTAVHYAAAHRLVYLRAVLAHGGGGRCGTKNRYGVTPLHVAAAARQVLGGPSPESVRILLECAPGTLAERDHRGNTPLHAVYAGVSTQDAGPSDLWSVTEDDGSKDAGVLKTLLDADADPNARNRDGDTPMLLLLKEKGVVFTHRSQLRLLPWAVSTRGASVGGPGGAVRGPARGIVIEGFAACVWSDQLEHSKADDEQEGRNQADCPSDGPDLGAHAGDRGVQIGLRGEGVHEPGFEFGKVGLRRQCIAVGAGGIAHHRYGRFGLVFVEAGIAKVLRGGAQGVLLGRWLRRGAYPDGPAGWEMASACSASMPAASRTRAAASALKVRAVMAGLAVGDTGSESRAPALRAMSSGRSLAGAFLLVEPGHGAPRAATSRASVPGYGRLRSPACMMAGISIPFARARFCAIPIRHPWLETPSRRVAGRWTRPLPVRGLPGAVRG